MNKLLKVKCPQCESIFNYYESESRPFCCERCKQIDLGHWFQETYRVPEKVQNEIISQEKSVNENEQENNNESEQNNDQEENYQESFIDEDLEYDKNEYE